MFIYSEIVANAVLMFEDWSACTFVIVTNVMEPSLECIFELQYLSAAMIEQCLSMASKIGYQLKNGKTAIALSLVADKLFLPRRE